MKDVLYIGPYYGKNDHGYIARSLIRELSGKCNLVTRPVYIHQDNITTDEFLPLEGTVDKIDVIIQDLPAYRLDYEGGVKNIVITHFPTLIPFNSTIVSRLNLMDEVWCLGNETKDNLETSGVTIPIRIYRPRFVEYELSNPVQVNNPGNFYVFGWEGEPASIDDLESFLTAFYLEFDPNEPVAALINVKDVNKTSQIIATIKQKLRLNNYKQEIICNLDFDNVCKIIPAINCLIRTVRGETFSRFSDQFYLTGKPIITTQEYGYPVKFNYVPCVCEDAPLGDLFTGREHWKQVDILDLQHQMRTEFLSQTTAKNMAVYSQPIKIEDLNSYLSKIEL